MTPLISQPSDLIMQETESPVQVLVRVRESSLWPNIYSVKRAFHSRRL